MKLSLAQLQSLVGVTFLTTEADLPMQVNGGVHYIQVSLVLKKIKSLF